VLSILVIDDEYGVRSGISQLLAMEGFSVAEAADGREALAQLAERTFDIALIDYQLPDIDGLTLLASIKGRNLPTMTCMITAYANIDTAIAATRRGIDFFLPKPFSPDDLLGVIETLSRHKRLREEADTLRRQNEANLLALATEKSQTSSLVASLRDAVLVVNREREVVLVNQPMASLIGRPQAELLRKSVVEVLGPGPLNELAQLLDIPGAERHVVELSLGEKVFVASSMDFHGEDGQDLGRILTLADVTDLRRMAMEKPRFIRTMVHEFRSPLGAIRGLLEVALEKTLGDKLAPYLPYLERADRRIDRMVELIGDLLSLSRIDLERTKATPSGPCSATACVSATLEMFQEQIASHRLDLLVQVDANLAVRIADDDLKTILTNLVANAIKYGRDGGKLQVRAHLAGTEAHVEVEDSGIGIRPENIERLFEEFFREKRPETRDIDGNGLGLSIVKRLAERAGGRIEVTSVVGQGSTFRIVLVPA
jgi:two-component system phosphate regulon sensor histidine kinase PhoR